MATPGIFNNGLAKATGIWRPTIVGHDRNLKIAGLRTKLGRGRSAAHVTPREAARLLTAICASKSMQDTCESVEKIEHTTVHPGRGVEEGWKDYVLPELADLPSDHSFVDALEALLGAVAGGSFARTVLEADHDGRPTLPWPSIDIEVTMPRGAARIAIGGFRGPRFRTVGYEQPDTREIRQVGAYRSGGLDGHVVRAAGFMLAFSGDEDPGDFGGLLAPPVPFEDMPSIDPPRPAK